MNTINATTAFTPDSLLPTTPAALLKILEKLEIPYEIHHHAPIFTVEEGASLKEKITGLHCRNLFLCDKKKNMFLVVLGNDTKLDFKKLDSLIGANRLSFGSPERLGQFLGIYAGAVCPFAALNDKDHAVQIILDAGMMAAETVNYHPLDNAQTLSLKPEALLSFFDYTGHTAKIIDLAPAAP